MRRPAIFVLLAGIAAMVAAMVVYSALKRREAMVRQAMAQSVNIVVAAHDLPVGTALDAAALKSMRWSRDSLPPGAIMNASTIIGQYTKSSFVENEPIVASRLFSSAKNAGILPLLIPSGMRAMSVPVDEVSDIAGFVLPHTHVDVLVSLSEGQKTMSRIVLQDVEVLAIAQDIERVNDQPQAVRVVTVLVTPEEAERLALASREGTLRLAMRNYTDKQIVNTKGIDLSQMMGDNPPAPVPMTNEPRPVFVAPPRRPPTVEVEILRDGKTSESVTFVRGRQLSSSVSSAPPSARAGAAPHNRADAPGAPEPDDASPPDAGAGVNSSPMGALSAPGPASSTAAAMADNTAPPAVLLPSSGADDSSEGYGGPKPHTIDVP